MENLVVRTSTAEKSVINVLETVNGPRLRAGAYGTVWLLGA